MDINGVFAIRGVKVIRGEKGPFVAMPQYKDSHGDYRDICFPCTKRLASSSTMRCWMPTSSRSGRPSSGQCSPPRSRPCKSPTIQNISFRRKMSYEEVCQEHRQFHPRQRHPPRCRTPPLR
ncbi:MAG: septation protein SpoVG family protein [Oscillospiraceae bacterium]